MINLIPESHLKQLGAAQHNAILMRYVFLSLISLLLVVAVHIFTFTMLKAAESEGNRAAEENKAKIAEYAEVKATAQQYKANLETAKALLDQNISYTGALFKLSKFVPKNTILQSVTLSPEIIGQATIIQARAKSYDDGIALKDSLIKSNIASDASLVNITDERTPDSELTGIQAEYPFSLSLSVTFTKELVANETTSTQTTTTSQTSQGATQ